MRLKRKWLFIPVLAAVVLVGIGIIGGAVYANSSASAASDNQTTFAARVAQILGIDQTKVESAFTQAKKEMRDDAMNAQLQKMIDNGKITQEQADQYKAWIQSKPDLPAELGSQGPMGGRGSKGGCFPGMGGRGFNFQAPPNATGSN
jgi:hypothetical protein